MRGGSFYDVQNLEAFISIFEFISKTYSYLEFYMQPISTQVVLVQ